MIRFLKGFSLLIFLICFTIFLSSCRVGRFFFYNFADITDYKIFPSRPVHRDSLNTFQFINAQKNSAAENITVTDREGNKISLLYMLQSTPTVAFIVIRNDSVLYENYLRNYEASSPVSSFSMSKSYISALIGIAIKEGFIKSENDFVTAYIPEFKGKYYWDKVTVHHLLQMSSGVKSSEFYYSPFSGAAALYYGTNLRKQLSKIKMYSEPGKKFEYKSINTQLLGLILERATGMSVSEYLEKKIWQPLGMEYDATWSLDKKKNGIEKAFCCINATARDFARFGRLYLNHGNWNGKQIVPAEWVEQSTKPNTEPGGTGFYNRHWWIPDQAEGSYTAIGHLGQYIFIIPGKNLIIIRLGNGKGKQPWLEIIKETAEYF
jgi:CubicO group peptidase (beta-lactamase class C family)